jgi:hypothetical protein
VQQKEIQISACQEKKKRYYVARDECREISDSSNEETTYQEVPVGSVAPATPTRKRFYREEAHAVKRGDVASPAVPAINGIIYDGIRRLVPHHVL